MKANILPIAACLAVALPASAHHAWVAKDAEGYKVVYGHETTQGYAPARVKEVSALDAKGKKVSVKLAPRDSGVVLEPAREPALFLVQFDNGYWTKTTDGSKNVSKKGITGYLSASKNVKYSKSVYTWTDKLLKPLGQTMEVVPASNPAQLKEGDSLSLTVYYEGKPLAGAPVSVSGGHDAADTTDAQGKAKVALPASGPSLVVASLKQPLKNDPDADTLSLSGALYLDLKK